MTLRTIWFFILIDVIIAAKLLNCPKADIQFEKVLGLRPADSSRPQLLHQSRQNAPITTECLAKCHQMDDCRSFVLFYNTTTCYWFKNAIQGVQEGESVVDGDAAWFIKVCLSSNNCEKLWIMERIPGATLIGNNTKILPNALTRSECQQHCLNEQDFVCKSAKFRVNTSIELRPNDEITGICVLSNADRHTLANSYRVSGFYDEYFENQCIPPEQNDQSQFCAYEEFENATLSHSDLLYENKSKETCQRLCEDTKIFHCRGYSLTVIRGRIDCLLHSEDSRVHGPRLVHDNPNGKFYEKAQCINISIACSETYITVNYAPKSEFTGKMYMQGYSEHPECFATGLGLNLITLKLPILSGQCGILQANAPDNRTLMAGTMILQNNPLVQTQSDRVIRIGCIYGNDSKLLIGTGVTITTAPNKGSSLLNLTNAVNSPLVEMRVLDLSTMQEVSTTQIGQELQLVIEIKPGNGSYDIWAGHLVAMTENSDESILLLDDRGCPTNINIFPALSKIVNNGTRKLVATFQAFKFSSSPVVRFSVIVQFCADNCPAVYCGTSGQSFGRRRRAIEPSTVVPVINGTKVISIDRSEFERDARMPLEFIMVVRNPNAIADRLILGDSKILVAGYDFTTNEVCLDYSLFIAMIVTWILIQVIFVVCCIVLVRRYKRYYEQECTRQSLEELHKNFGIGFSNLDNRRVHWADNGGDLT